MLTMTTVKTVEIMKGDGSIGTPKLLKTYHHFGFWTSTVQ